MCVTNLASVQFRNTNETAYVQREYLGSQSTMCDAVSVEEADRCDKLRCNDNSI